MTKYRKIVFLSAMIFASFLSLDDSAAAVLFQDDFDNWPQVNGGDWYCCNAINTSCPTNERNAMPLPWDVLWGYCGTANNAGGYDNNTIKIVDGRSGKGKGECRKGGVNVGIGYLGYIAPNGFNIGQYRKFYVRYYMKWPAALSKPLVSPFAFKLDRFDSDSNFAVLLMGWANDTPPKTIQTANLGFGTRNNNYNMYLPLSVFNNDFVYLEYLIDLDSGTLKFWYGDTYNTESNPFWTQTGIDFGAGSSGTISYFSIGIGNTTDSDWTNPDWQCMTIDDLVVSTSWVGPIGNNPDTTPPAAPNGVVIH